MESKAVLKMNQICISGFKISHWTIFIVIPEGLSFLCNVCNCNSCNNDIAQRTTQFVLMRLTLAVEQYAIHHFLLNGEKFSI